MCWEIDYPFYAEQKKQQEARIKQERIKQEQRAGVIDQLLSDANKPGETPKVEEAPAKEVAPAK
jgi:hypothetical protein